METKSILALILALPLAGCTLPGADEPAHPNRMGRFIGLVANCGCGTGLTTSQVMAGYPQVAGGAYSPEDLRRMHGFVEVGATERFSNQYEICAEVCVQACKVNTVAAPLGGRTIPGAEPCPITERGLHLTLGRTDGGPWW